MTKQQKSVDRLLSKPADFTWDELIRLVSAFGYELRTAGGSGRKFFDPLTGAVIFMHEPHPGKILKAYQVRAVIQFLRQEKKV